MAASMNSLSQNSTPDELRFTHKVFPDDALFDWACRKGVFSYDHVNSWSVLEETSLLLKEAFFSKLKGKPISDENYKHANAVWSAMNLSTLNQYTDLYLKINVLLLSDNFKSFCDLCIKHYGLEVAAFYLHLGWRLQVRSRLLKLSSNCYHLEGFAPG